ncbi:MAG: hypothetical protein LBN99_04130 [Oscillospiraceae bacterium]|jgi:hypothetical protein|nr:hypothetical protein [Oscillospiraceae bacterium]
MKKVRKKIVVLLVIGGLLLLFCLPIKVKQSVNIEIAPEEMAINIKTLVGQSITLLCERASREVTDPPAYEFVILAVANEKSVFEPLLASHGLYVSPKCFVGGAIKRGSPDSNPANDNRFIFRGVLKTAPEENGSYYGDFAIKFESWDIVYPVQHFGIASITESELFKRNLFIFDYFIP